MKLIANGIFATFLAAGSASAIILYGGDNSANTTNPGTGVPYDSVARVSDAFGGGTTGSAVYLGNGFMLTAAHVNQNTSVTFDGVNFYTWDTTFTPVTPGTADAKIFRLTTAPTVAAVQLYAGSGELLPGNNPATIVGWGIGRDPSTPVDTATVPWGDASTIAKRWGVNEIEDVVSISGGYTYSALRTVTGGTLALPPGLGANEAGATTFDSGSGLFQNIGGTWYLTGLTTGVESPGTTIFGGDSVAIGGTENYFVRISTIQSQILATIPEPSVLALLPLAGIGAFLRRRR